MPDVLVVEDSCDIAEAYVLLLRKEGYTADCVEHGRAALAYMEGALLPRLIVFDLNMPVMDGWEFRRRQLADPRLADIPVIVLSGSGQLDNIIGLRAAAVMRKPFSLLQLPKVVGQYMEPSQRAPNGESALCSSP
jgi:CheY-like chemotaxis protein